MQNKYLAFAKKKKNPPWVLNPSSRLLAGAGLTHGPAAGTAGQVWLSTAALCSLTSWGQEQHRARGPRDAPGGDAEDAGYGALLPPPTPIFGVQRCLPAQPHAGADRIQGAQPCGDTWGHPGESSVHLSDSREGLMEEVQGGGRWS